MYQILHYLISITRLKENQVIKFNFTLTTRATLNPLHNYFALGLTWEAALKILHVKFDLFTDMDMHLLTEEGNHGGISVINYNTNRETFRKWRITVQISDCTKKFPIKDFFSERDRIRSFQRICSHLLEKSLMENFFFQWAQQALGVRKCKQIFMDRQWRKLFATLTFM